MFQTGNLLKILDSGKKLIRATELEVFSIFKLYWDIGILGTVQACTVLNIAKLRMLE